jgi:hypothetical protein
MPTFLKSMSGPMAALTERHGPIHLPPPPHANLQGVYDDEAHYIRLMRSGRAVPIWYGWCPAKSLSVSTREAARLGDISGFAEEPIAIRQTGGTVVPQGPGTLNISVISRHKTHPGIRETYAAVCQALAKGFAAVGIDTEVGARPGSFCDGDFNLLHRGRKLVGTAQRWAMGADGTAICLHHCVILTGGDPDSLCRRAEALYDHAGKPTRYTRDAHSTRVINHDDLLAAMDKSLTRFIQGGKV